MARQTIGGSSIGVSTEAALGQNTPNPFVISTTVRLSVPGSAQLVLLSIHDMSGKQLRQLTIAGRGDLSIALTNEGLAPGMYLYSLTVDGNLIGTKRMIIVK